MQIGSVYQVAYLVDDLERAARDWAALTGAGPFMLFDPFEFNSPVYRGEPCVVDMGIALAFSGELCIELIVQRDDQPSIYSDWRRERGFGMHHVAELVDDFPAALAHYAGRGKDPVFSGGFGEDTHLAYLDTTSEIGCFLELVERTSFVRDALAAMREAHRAWDGTDVLRPFMP